jgi:hypothetical protein
MHLLNQQIVGFLEFEIDLSLPITFPLQGFKHSLFVAAFVPFLPFLDAHELCARVIKG